MKKIVVLLLVCAMFIVFVPSVKAYTMDDLYTQIESLQKQIANLQTELSSLALRAATTVEPVAKTVTPVVEKVVVPVVNTVPVVEKVVVPTVNIAPKVISVPTVVPATKTILPVIMPVTKTIIPEKIISPIVAPSVTSAKKETPIANSFIGFGMTGNDVKTLQSSLVAAGFLTGKVDGKFGILTQQAVGKYQKANNLQVTGKVNFTFDDSIFITLEDQQAYEAFARNEINEYVTKYSVDRSKYAILRESTNGKIVPSLQFDVIPIKDLIFSTPLNMLKDGQTTQITEADGSLDRDSFRMHSRSSTIVSAGDTLLHKRWWGWKEYPNN